MGARRLRPYLHGTVVLLLALGGLWIASRAWPRRTNVVIVVVDTLRRDHLAAYGYARDTTPFLDGLIRHGVLLDGLSPSSWTKPATASLLTGLYPVTHQAVARQDRLPAGVVTLAQALKGEGYHTLAGSTNNWVSPDFGFDRGFDEFLLEDSLPAREFNKELLPRVRSLEEPFFAYVHYTDPHAPYEPATDWNGQPRSASTRPVSVEDLDATHVEARPPDLLRRAVDLYDGEIRGADDGLAELIGVLRSRGVLDRTLLVFTADHGEEFQEHGRMSHGQSLYQEVVQVPLVFHGPGLREGTRLGRASLVDVAPTIVDLIQAPAARKALELDGVSLAASLRSGRALPVDRGFLGHLDFVDGIALSYTRGNNKIVLAKHPYAKEIFDLATDSAEKKNRLGTPDGGRRLLELGSEAASAFNAYAARAFPRTTTSLNEDLASRLAAVGYLSSGASPAPRGIPFRIVAPDQLPDGRLGWEPTERPSACAELTDPVVEQLLLAGWYEAQEGGRWTGPTGTMLVGLPVARPGRLQIRGTNHRGAPTRLRAAVDDRVVFDGLVPAGPFALDAAIPAVEGGPTALLRLSSPAFVPRDHGMADPRVLGLLFSSICVR